MWLKKNRHIVISVATATFFSTTLALEREKKHDETLG